VSIRGRNLIGTPSDGDHLGLLHTRESCNYLHFGRVPLGLGPDARIPKDYGVWLEIAQGGAVVHRALQLAGTAPEQAWSFDTKRVVPASRAAGSESQFHRPIEKSCIFYDVTAGRIAVSCVRFIM